MPYGRCQASNVSDIALALLYVCPCQMEGISTLLSQFPSSRKVYTGRYRPVRHIIYNHVKDQPADSEALPDSCHGNIMVNEASTNDGHCSKVAETFSDSDHNRRLAPKTIGETAALQKSFGLDPQEVHGPEECADMDWTETEVCIKCDNGGNLLFCSDSNCPLAVHEECMHCSAQFDSLGNFYCPYCSHKRAMLETRKAREKAMLAKKALSAFLDEGMKQTVGDTKADNRNRLDGDGADYHFAQTEEDQVDETEAEAEVMQDQEKGTALSSSGDDIMQQESVEDGDISDGENGYVSPHPRRVKEKNQNGIQSPRVNSPRRSASKLSMPRANSVHKEKKNATPKSGL